MTLIPENDCLALLKYDEQQGFKCFFDRHFQLLCDFANRKIKDKQAAEAIVLIAFEKFWGQPKRFETDSNVAAFLYTIVTNECRNFYKDAYRSKISKTDLDLLLEEFEVENENDGIRNERLQIMQREVEKLPPRRRRIIELLLEGYSYREIASELKININTVYSVKSKFIKSMRDKRKQGLL
jgi:RNA polymerase sigma-70 factor (ECF subfamily)